MIIQIEDIDENGLKIKTTRKPDWATNIPDLHNGTGYYNSCTNIDFNLSLFKVSREVSVRGNIDFGVNAPCSRCLDSISLYLKADINLLLTPKESIDDIEGDIDHEVYEDSFIDLSNYLKEQIALSLPYKVLCKDECRGLCYCCGTNLNTDNCDCETKWVDSRFDALKGFRI